MSKTTKKATKIEVEKRVIAISQYLLKGYSKSDIVRNGSEQWGIEERQIEKYLARAWEKLKLDSKFDIEESKAFHKNARLESYRKLYSFREVVLSNTDMDMHKKTICLATVSKRIDEVLKDMAKIDGLYIDKKEISGKDGKELSIILNFPKDE